MVFLRAIRSYFEIPVDPGIAQVMGSNPVQAWIFFNCRRPLQGVLPLSLNGCIYKPNLASITGANVHKGLAGLANSNRRSCEKFKTSKARWEMLWGPRSWLRPWPQKSYLHRLAIVTVFVQHTVQSKSDCVNPCMPASRWRRLLKLKRKKTLLRLSLASFSPHHYS